MTNEQKQRRLYYRRLRQVAGLKQKLERLTQLINDYERDEFGTPVFISWSEQQTVLKELLTGQMWQRHDNAPCLFWWYILSMPSIFDNVDEFEEGRPDFDGQDEKRNNKKYGSNDGRDYRYICHEIERGWIETIEPHWTPVEGETASSPPMRKFRSFVRFIRLNISPAIWNVRGWPVI